MGDEPLWTVRRTAHYLSVSETTVRVWQQAHLLPFLKIGGSIRFVPHEIRQWAADRAVAPREEMPRGWHPM
ncbi:MAG: helix-turn-helix domain-containing protein, partial [Acidimicrobiia bacterium]